MPVDHSFAFGESSVSAIRDDTPGISTALKGRLVPPLALNQSNTVWTACGVVISGALGSWFTAGPRYGHWNSDELPPGDVSARLVLSDVTYRAKLPDADHTPSPVGSKTTASRGLHLLL